MQAHRIPQRRSRCRLCPLKTTRPPTHPSTLPPTRTLSLQAKLRVVPWDGYLKYYNLGEKHPGLIEKRRKVGGRGAGGSR